MANCLGKPSLKCVTTCTGEHQGDCCDHHARFVEWRKKTIVSLFGPIVLLLAYYRCSRCGTSQKPWDHTLGLTHKALTPAAAQVTAQAGVLASFAEASEKTLRTMWAADQRIDSTAYDGRYRTLREGAT